MFGKVHFTKYIQKLKLNPLFFKYIPQYKFCLNKYYIWKLVFLFKPKNTWLTMLYNVYMCMCI